MVKKIHFFILPTSSLIYGISWAVVYLTFSAFHGMTKMFNDDFVFLIASVFNIKISSITAGLTFAFFDGALVGLIVGTLIIMLFKKNEV
ncbi:MAG: hypothetical protein IPJ03_19020 [Ignavibacteriales bacterium]|nr:hypothetical protein [Ignavibacteriales bacterium]MBK7381047.1 hypothetical protein [Ignavibacteriales bacterium]